VITPVEKLDFWCTFGHFRSNSLCWQSIAFGRSRHGEPFPGRNTLIRN
jgi:hypothetical protein